jgi:uncharacterized protein (DUF488 family)
MDVTDRSLVWMVAMRAQSIYTVGHSTRPVDELIGLLEARGVRELADVRSVPASRRNPQFAQAALARSLDARGIVYRHEPDLGGFRRPRSDSPNLGWENLSFRGYADYMAGDAFRGALRDLKARAAEHTVCVMCAEGQWWRCHRRLIADALLVQGWRVEHLGLAGEPVPHELTSFASVGADGSITYPPLQLQLQTIGDA